MGLSAADIAGVIEEVAPAVVGGWIQKVYQPSPRTVTLDIRTPGQTVSLLISADPENARLHLLTLRHSNPPLPPSFCQYLRAHIQGARIDTIEQVQGDRIVRLRMTSRDGPCALLAELMGRRANVLMLDGENRIVTTLEPAPDLVGTVYRPPTRKDFSDSAPASHTLESTDGAQPFPVSFAIEQRYRAREEESAQARWKQARLSDLKKRIKKSTRRAEALRGDLEKAARYKDYARYGELLKASLHRMQKGHDQLAAIDYFDPTMPELVIPLDPAKSPQGNLDDYFKKHRKYVAAERELRPRLTRAEEEVAGLRAERTKVEGGILPPDSALVKRTDKQSAFSRLPSLKTKDDTRAGPFRRFLSLDGLPIYVGRNAKENEALTFGEARPDDLWLHAHGTPGSHVIVRLEKGADPPSESVRDAATLALLYSDLKKSGKGEVIYARRKYVRKVKGKPPGTVTVTEEKSVFVTLDRVRLDRLKAQAGDLQSQRASRP